MRSVRTWFILHTAWVAAQGEFWHLHTPRLSASPLPSNPYTLSGRARRGCAARNPLPEGISLSRDQGSRGSSPLGLHHGQKQGEELLAARLRLSFKRSARSKQSWDRAALQGSIRNLVSAGQENMIAVPLLRQNQSMAKGRAVNKRTESHMLLQGRKRSWATRQLCLSTLGLLLGNWIYFGSCSVRLVTPGSAGRDAPRARRQLAALSYQHCCQQQCTEWAYVPVVNGKAGGKVNNGKER